MWANNYLSPKSFLSRIYRNHILQEKILANPSNMERWDVYDMILIELKELGYKSEIEEILYRITDDENPNDVILDVLRRLPDKSINLIICMNNVMIFDDEDWGKIFPKNF